MIFGQKLENSTIVSKKRLKQPKRAQPAGLYCFFLASKQEYQTHFSYSLVLKMSTQGELLEKVHQYICDVRRFHGFFFFVILLSLFDLPILSFLRKSVLWLPKGHLISKANFEVFIWTKNRSKYFSISALGL